jgi:hypothetical protein
MESEKKESEPVEISRTYIKSLGESGIMCEKDKQYILIEKNKPKYSFKGCGYKKSIKTTGFIDHVKKVHMGISYKCPLCNHEINQLGNLLNHHIPKSHNFLYCLQCYEKCDSFEELQKHKSTPHTNYHKQEEVYKKLPEFIKEVYKKNIVNEVFELTPLKDKSIPIIESPLDIPIFDPSPLKKSTAIIESPLDIPMSIFDPSPNKGDISIFEMTPLKDINIPIFEVTPLKAKDDDKSPIKITRGYIESLPDKKIFCEKDKKYLLKYNDEFHTFEGCGHIEPMKRTTFRKHFIEEHLNQEPVMYKCPFKNCNYQNNQLQNLFNYHIPVNHNFLYCLKCHTKFGIKKELDDHKKVHKKDPRYDKKQNQVEIYKDLPNFINSVTVINPELNKSNKRKYSNDEKRNDEKRTEKKRKTETRLIERIPILENTPDNLKTILPLNNNNSNPSSHKTLDFDKGKSSRRKSKRKSLKSKRKSLKRESLKGKSSRRKSKRKSLKRKSKRKSLKRKSKRKSKRKERFKYKYEEI